MTNLFGDDHDFDEAHDEVEPGSRRARRQAAVSAPHPHAPRRRGRGGSVASFVLMLMLLGGFVAGGWWVVSNVFGGGSEDPSQGASDFPGPGSGEVLVTIPSGATGGAIGLILKDAGVVATADAFAAAYTANPNATSIQPGTYTLMREMKASDAVAALLDPSTRADTTITIPEGFRTDQIYARLADRLGVPVEDVVAAAHDYAAFGLDGPPNTNPEALDPMEGWFYPATYTVPPDGTVAELLKQMFDRTVAELDALGVVPEDRIRVLTIGSIAIREASFEDDWARVSRVIENRLLPGNPTGSQHLGMDSTLTYWWDITHPGEEMDPALHNSETGPYNTRPPGPTGLPPSPIASIDSRVMNAALYPEEGDWVYFVSVNMCPPGDTRFTASQEEFNQLRAQYQDWNQRWVAAGRTCPFDDEE